MTMETSLKRLLRRFKWKNVTAHRDFLSMEQLEQTINTLLTTNAVPDNNYVYKTLNVKVFDVFSNPPSDWWHLCL